MDVQQETMIICAKCGRKYHEADLIPEKVETHRKGWRKAQVCPHCHTDYYLMDMDEGCGKQDRRHW